jgi:hypothetical protein
LCVDALILIALLSMAAAPARAAFTGPYALDNFSLFNTNADGSVSSPDGVSNLILTGGNNGSGLPGSTYFLIFAAAPSWVSFQFEQTTDDDPTIPELDTGGYLIGPKFTALATVPASGDARFFVEGGQGFGFGMLTDDNWGGAATLTITEFDVQPVPEPGTGIAVLGGVLAICYGARRRRSPL